MGLEVYKRLYSGSELEKRINIQERYSQFNFKEWFRFLYNFKETDRVLDLGCGNGRQLLYFSSYFRNGFGVDGSKSLIAKAENAKAELKIKNVRFIYADCNRFLLNNTKFDVILSNFAFYYFNEKEVIKNIIKMLSETGAVFISGSPDENAPEFSSLISKLLKEKDIPLIYKKGFSDVRKYFALFRRYFRFIHFYRFVNIIKFPTPEGFYGYLKNTSLVQFLEPNKKEIFLKETYKILKKRRGNNLTKIVDVLRASNK